MFIDSRVGRADRSLLDLGSHANDRSFPRQARVGFFVFLPGQNDELFADVEETSEGNGTRRAKVKVVSG